jgi:hypothetical protein
MGFDGSAIDRLLEDAVTDGTCHGVAALVVDRDGVLHRAVPERRRPRRCFATPR